MMHCGILINMPIFGLVSLTIPTTKTTVSLVDQTTDGVTGDLVVFFYRIHTAWTSET